MDAIYCPRCELWLNGMVQWNDHRKGKMHRPKRSSRRVPRPFLAALPPLTEWTEIDLDDITDIASAAASLSDLESVTDEDNEFHLDGAIWTAGSTSREVAQGQSLEDLGVLPTGGDNFSVALDRSAMAIPPYSLQGITDLEAVWPGGVDDRPTPYRQAGDHGPPLLRSTSVEMRRTRWEITKQRFARWRKQRALLSMGTIFGCPHRRALGQQQDVQHWQRMRHRRLKNIQLTIRRWLEQLQWGRFRERAG